MKYDFNQYVGDKTLVWDRLKCYDRMVDVLYQTGSKVNFHIRSKSWRKDNWHFLAPIGMICYEDGKVKMYEVHGWTKIDKGEVPCFRLSCDMMIQIIKKALKNKMRTKDTTNKEL
jgi:hypothetical protein